MKLPERFDKVEERLAQVEVAIAELKMSNRLASKLLKYVILPLIAIVAGVLGVRLW